MLTDVLFAAKAFGFKRRNDLDDLDHAHGVITPCMLAVFAALVSFKQFGGKPIECMVPKTSFPDGGQHYATQWCWAVDRTNAYPFDNNTEIPDVYHSDAAKISKRRAKDPIRYYQWVPFFLLFQAACFRLPSLIWKFLAEHSGLNIHDLVTIAADPENVKPKAKAANVKALTLFMEKALRFHRRLRKNKMMPHRTLRFLNLPYTASYVTFVYIIVKACYLSNIILQLYFMNRFLNIDSWYGTFGFWALRDAIAGVRTNLFPLVTFCDIQIRVMGNQVQTYTLQCMLIINLFNQWIFILLWFWYVMLLTLTVISLIYWFFIMVLPCLSRTFISRHLQLSDMPFDPTESRKDVDRFVAGYLRSDGVFVLRMIANHAGVIFATDLVLELWRAFYGIEETYRLHVQPGLLASAPLKNDEKHGVLRMRKFRPATTINAKDVEKHKLLSAQLPNGGETHCCVARKDRMLEDADENKTPVAPSTDNATTVTANDVAAAVIKDDENQNGAQKLV